MPARPTRVTVDLDAITHNLQVVRGLAPGGGVCGVIKADAYGHGALPVARALAAAGIEWLAVATVEEGVALREGGITAPILAMFGGYDVGYAELLAHDLTPSLWRADQLESYSRAAQGKRAPFHLKIDTGMRRIGLRAEHLSAFIDALRSCPNLVLDGVYTHFANADLGDLENDRLQLARFQDARLRLRERGYEPRWVHLSNSAGSLTFPEGHGNLLRPGLLLYGLDPRPPQSDGFPHAGLRPAMRWSTEVINVEHISKGERVSYGGRWAAPRDSVVATIPAGYADGYLRALSDRAHVLVRGKRAKVAGTICMDLFLVDVTHIPGVRLGDEVVLLGAQDDDAVTAYDLAGWAGTIPYEIVCGVGARVARQYTQESVEPT